MVDVTARPSDFDPWEDMTLVGRDGFVLHTIGLADAAGYVVPITFEACYEDPASPYDVTLEIEVRISAGVIVREVRIVPKRARTFPSAVWRLQGMSEAEHIGEIHVPTTSLTREAQAHAAMPAARPHVDEMGYHAETVLALFPKERRKPRKSSYERDLMRHYYADALKQPNAATKRATYAYMYEKLNEKLPEQFPYTDDDRRGADYMRLRVFFDENRGRTGAGWPT